MTLKNSLISVSVAALLVAGITGCSSNSTTTTPTAVVDETTSSVTAVDGYIINATATAVYFDENNISRSVSMTSTLATTDAVDSTLNTVGAADYTMSDDTNASLVRYFTLANKVIGLSGTTTTPATFIDHGDTTGVSDANDTAFATRFAGITLYAPAQASVITPISSLVFQQAGGTAAFTPAAMGDLNQTVIDNAYDTIAAKLGLNADTIQDIDPTNDVTTTPEYALMNTLIAQTISDGNIAAFTTALVAEANATSATTFTQTITKLQTASTTAGGTNVFTNVLADIALTGETAYVADIPSLNLDNTLNNAGVAAYNSASSTAVASVTGMTVGGVDAFTLAAAGDKIGNTDAEREVIITFAAAEANSTGTADLLIQVAGGVSAESNTTANSSEITIKVTDLNLSTDVTNAMVSLNETAATRFSFAYQENNATAISFKKVIDANATAAGIADFIAITGTTATLDIGALIDDVEDNITGFTGFTDINFELDTIHSMKVSLVDGGLLQRVNGSGQRQVWGSTSIASIADSSEGNVSGSGLTIVNLAKADSRSNTTALNTAPAIGTMDGNATDSIVVVDYANAAPVSNPTFTVTTTEDTGELGNSVTVSGLPTWVTVTAATVVSTAATNNVDFNVTVDSNLSLGDTNATGIAFTVTDEFGKVNTTDGNLTYFFNAYPVVSTTSALVTNFTKVSATSYTADINTTAVGNTDIVFNLTNLMGEQNATVTDDVNATLLAPAVVLNATTGVGTITLRDLNESTQDADIAITINGTLGALANVVLDLNVSN